MFLPSNITLQFGDSGDFVSELQRRLAMVQCFSENMVNGFFDGNTVNGVTRFQGMVGLHADGVAGPETLRRLNGVITGGSAASDKKEEEKKQAAAPQVNPMLLYGQPQTPENPAIFGTRPPDLQTEPPPQPLAQQTELPPMQPLNEQQQAQHKAREAELLQQQQREQVKHSALADMLLSKPTPQAELQTEHGRNPQQVTASQQVETQTAQQSAQALEKHEPKTFIGRAIKFASAYMQKLSDYFHHKLAPSVLDEVHEIGMLMRQNGVKEAPIPMGPEMARAPQAQGRSDTPQVQQQNAQRG